MAHSRPFWHGKFTPKQVVCIVQGFRWYLSRKITRKDWKDVAGTVEYSPGEAEQIREIKENRTT